MLVALLSQRRIHRPSSPAGSPAPTGAGVVMDPINIFRFDDDGRLIEEFVPTDYRSLLRQLGAEGRRRARPLVS